MRLTGFRAGRSLTGIGCALILGCAPSGEDAPPATPDERPNVLFILSDDLRPELGAYGSEHAITPHLDRLASEGLLFERAYVHVASCNPSRTALLTGLRPDSTGVYSNQTPLHTVGLDDHVTLPRHFRNHGYTTFSIGKVYHHAENDPEAWSVPPIEPEGDWSGPYRGGAYVTEESARAVQQYVEDNPNRDRERGPSYEIAAVPDTAYPDGKIAVRAIEQLERVGDEPFFMAVGFVRPHLPFNAPTRYWDMYPPGEIALPDNYFEPENVTEYSLSNYGELLDYTDTPEEGPIPEDLALTLRRGYFASVSYMDAQVGRLLDALDRLGLADNTIVVFWGDHGFKVAEHRSWSKATNFEIDTRIPLIARVPGMQTAGQRSHAFVETVDLYPTLSDLAGLPAPAVQLQGLSVEPLFHAPDRPWKSAAFSQFPRGDVMGRAIRTDDYRYVEWRREPEGTVVARELYDHTTDPQENVNVAGDPRYADVVGELSGRLADGWRAALPTHRSS